MNRKWAALLSLLLLAGTLSACTGRRSFTIFPQMSSSSEAVSQEEREILSADEPAAQDEVALYAKLGDDPSIRMERQKITEAYYRVDADVKKLMERWDISEKRYVFIGWFFMDEQDKPGKWAGDNEVRFRKEGEKRLVAVFNTHGG